MNAVSSIRAGLVALLGAVAAAGCVVTPVGPYGPPRGGGVVAAPPPAPRAEVVGVAPITGHIWISGYWGWGGGGYRWVPGYWSAPRPGHVWVPHAWVRHGHGWQFNPGHWRRH